MEVEERNESRIMETFNSFINLDFIKSLSWEMTQYNDNCLRLIVSKWLEGVVTDVPFIW